MANITILDTGYPNNTNGGTQESTGNMANSGSAIELKSVEVDYERNSNNDNSPVPGKYSNSPLSFVSVNNPKLNIKGVLDRQSTADMDLITELDKLCTTKGIKLLYYNSTSDGYRDLTDSLGSTDTHHLLNLTKHFHGRIISFRITHSSSVTHLRYSLVYEVTG